MRFSTAYSRNKKALTGVFTVSAEIAAAIPRTAEIRFSARSVSYSDDRYDEARQSVRRRRPRWARTDDE